MCVCVCDCCNETPMASSRLDTGYEAAIQKCSCLLIFLIANFVFELCVKV